MRYPQFRAKGLCISSGVVEAGCKQIGARPKRASMRWTVDRPARVLAEPAGVHAEQGMEGEVIQKGTRGSFPCRLTSGQFLAGSWLPAT